MKAEKILVIGSVEPHYFAGYTGGRKGIIPGISGFTTIEQNHKLALHSEAASLVLEGNPVHEDMLEVLSFLKNKRIFSIMTVLNKDHGLHAVRTGDIQGAFKEAVKKAAEVFVVPVSGKADIIITCAKYPMDLDLYQSQKALDNAKLAVKENGIIILVSSCRNGIGEEAFISLLSSSRTTEEVLNNIKENYKLGYHKAGKMVETFLKCQVWTYTELNPNMVAEIFMNPINNLQDGIIEALEKVGLGAKVIVFPDGCVTVPAVNK